MKHKEKFKSPYVQGLAKLYCGTGKHCNLEIRGSEVGRSQFDTSEKPASQPGKGKIAGVL